MVKEGAGWFDQNTSGLNKRTGIQVQGSNRAYQLAAPVGGMPATWQSGETRNLSVQINNTGQEAWNAGGEHNVRLGVSFGRNSDVPHADWATDQRFYLISDVPASGSQTLPTVAVTAPTDPGQYTLRFRMVKEGVEWFDLDTTSGFAKFPVTVGAPAGTPELRYRLAAPMSALSTYLLEPRPDHQPRPCRSSTTAPRRGSVEETTVSALASSSAPIAMSHTMAGPATSARTSRLCQAT